MIKEIIGYLKLVVHQTIGEEPVAHKRLVDILSLIEEEKSEEEELYKDVNDIKRLLSLKEKIDKIYQKMVDYSYGFNEDPHFNPTEFFSSISEYLLKNSSLLTREFENFLRENHKDFFAFHQKRLIKTPSRPIASVDLNSDQHFETIPELWSLDNNKPQASAPKKKIVLRSRRSNRPLVEHLPDTENSAKEEDGETTLMDKFIRCWTTSRKPADILNLFNKEEIETLFQDKQFHLELKNRTDARHALYIDNLYQSIFLKYPVDLNFDLRTLVEINNYRLSLEWLKSTPAKRHFISVDDLIACYRAKESKQIAELAAENLDIRQQIFRKFTDVYKYTVATKDFSIDRYKDIQEIINSFDKVLLLLQHCSCPFQQLSLINFAIGAKYILGRAEVERILPIVSDRNHSLILDKLFALGQLNIDEYLELADRFHVRDLAELTPKTKLYSMLHSKDKIVRLLEHVTPSKQLGMLKDLFFLQRINFTEFLNCIDRFTIPIQTHNVLLSTDDDYNKDAEKISYLFCQIVAEIAALKGRSIPESWYYEHTVLQSVGKENLTTLKKLSPVTFNYLLKLFPQLLLNNPIRFEAQFPHLKRPLNRELASKLYFGREREKKDGDLHPFSFEKPHKCPEGKADKKESSRVYKKLAFFDQTNTLENANKLPLYKQFASKFMSHEDYFYSTQFGESGFYQNKINLTSNVDFHTSATDSKLSQRLIPGLAQVIHKQFVARTTIGPFNLLEIGAGDGSLCIKLLNYIQKRGKTEASWQQLYDNLNYATMDLSKRLLATQAQRIKENHSMKAVKHYHGNALRIQESEFYCQNQKADLILSNELMDMFPPRKIIMGQGGQLFEEFIVPVVKIDELKKYFSEVDISKLAKENLGNIECLKSCQLLEEELLTSDNLFLSKEQFEYLQKYYAATAPISNFYTMRCVRIPIDYDPVLSEFIGQHPSLLEVMEEEDYQFITPTLQQFMEGLISITNDDGQENSSCFVHVDYGSHGYDCRNKPLRTYGRNRTVAGSNIFETPGALDITYDVNFTVLGEIAKQQNYHFLVVDQNDLDTTVTRQTDHNSGFFATICSRKDMSADYAKKQYATSGVELGRKNASKFMAKITI